MESRQARCLRCGGTAARVSNILGANRPITECFACGFESVVEGDLSGVWRLNMKYKYEGEVEWVVVPWGTMAVFGEVA